MSRTLPIGFGDDATALCWCWTVTRADAVVLGFTDHDRDLVVENVTHRAATGRLSGASDTGVGLRAGSGAVAGVLEDAGITDADLAAGVYDGAGVALRRVRWDDPAKAVLVWQGQIGAVRRGEIGFEAELTGLEARLERSIGRTIQRRCDADLGDARCGVDLDALDQNVRQAGCDKRWSTCRDVFSNIENFRGFPMLPGTDWLISTPRRDGTNDGGSLWPETDA